jgi:hypothetical protein
LIPESGWEKELASKLEEITKNVDRRNVIIIFVESLI